MVGAGLAGLRASARVRDAGADVELIEAGLRLGGRVRTVRAPFLDRQYVESGAEWVDADHPLMLDLLDCCGATLQGDGMDWTTVRRMLFRDGRIFRPDELRELEPSLDDDLARYEGVIEAIAAGISDPSRPDLHPGAADHDARSLADLAAEIGFGPVAELFARRNSQGEFAAEQSQVSLLFVAQQRAIGAVLGARTGHRSFRVEGGLDRAVAYLADQVSACTSLDEALLAVDWSHAGVSVRTTRRTITADHLVLACSLVALRCVVFTPALPGSLARAIAELGYGTVTKTALQYQRGMWPHGFVNTVQPSQRVYEPTVAQAGGHGVLMAYSGGSGGHALAAFDEAERIRRVAADQREMFGLEAAPTGGFSRAWSTLPRFGGSYAVYEPGQVTSFWRVLRQPCGPIHLAGEHVATWTGYMEGALETADRVADRILDEASGP